MIQAKKITKYILGEPLFRDVSFVLNAGDKVGLVGPNGSGKSTLMRMILNLSDYDGGSIQIEHERIAYLPQEILSENEGLSSGQKTKLALETILAQKPTVLLLDEPTNHLDIKGLLWLENIIKSFNGIVIVISHDRALLDNSVTKIFEIDSANATFNEYQGGYTDYISEKERNMKLQEKEYLWQQREKKRLELWLTLKRQDARVRPDPAKGKQIRAMEKRLEREIYSKEISKPSSFKKIREINLAGKTHTSKLILQCETVAKSIGSKVILRNITMEIRGREKVLLSGENGSGKTTLLKILMGEVKMDKGSTKIGQNVQIGYFSQEHEYLDRDKTVMEEFMATERMLELTKDARVILGSYLFKGQDVYKKISDLSLGERVRLIFAKLSYQKNELLILDEPTNHLDIASREIIEKALIDYEGALLVVSHDRYFIEKIGFDREVRIIRGMTF